MPIVSQAGKPADHRFLPFDDENVIAGQGTVALEIIQDLDDIDAVIVPIGGGGLISGIAYTLKAIRPSIKVYGVQVAGAPSMYNSIKNQKIECLDSVHTIADCGGNVTSVHHERANAAADIIGCYLRIEMETRDYAHVNLIIESLRQAGFKIVE